MACSKLRSPRAWIAGTRTRKNSSRFEEKIARNRSRSSTGCRRSEASCSTRWLNDSQLKCRSIMRNEALEGLGHQAWEVFQIKYVVAGFSPRLEIGHSKPRSGDTTLATGVSRREPVAFDWRSALGSPCNSHPRA